MEVQWQQADVRTACRVHADYSMYENRTCRRMHAAAAALHTCASHMQSDRVAHKRPTNGRLLVS